MSEKDERGRCLGKRLGRGIYAYGRAIWERIIHPGLYILLWVVLFRTIRPWFLELIEDTRLIGIADGLAACVAAIATLIVWSILTSVKSRAREIMGTDKK